MSEQQDESVGVPYGYLRVCPVCASQLGVRFPMPRHDVDYYGCCSGECPMCGCEFMLSVKISRPFTEEGGSWRGRTPLL